MTRCEYLVALVRRDLAGSIRVGYALAQLRQEQHYRPRYRTWAHFLRAEFGISGSRASRLIAAAHLLERFQCHDLPLPKNERVARPLLSLPEADQEGAWKECLNTSPRRPVTAHHVESVCRGRQDDTPALPRATRTLGRFPRARRRPTPTAPAPIRKSCREAAMEDLLRELLRDGAPFTDDRTARAEALVGRQPQTENP